MKRTFKLAIINDNHRSVEEVELDNDLIPLENNIITIRAREGNSYSTRFSKDDIDFYFNNQQTYSENLLRYLISVGSREYEDICSELLTHEDLTEIIKVVTPILPKFSGYLKCIDTIINKIKDTNTLFFGTLFKTLEIHAAKFILKELGFPEESNNIFLPKDCKVEIIDNKVNCYYLDFENDGSGENTSASLFNEFIIFYERLFYCRKPLGNKHPIISRWGGKVLIDANRPVNDPLKDILLGKRHLVFNNCGFFDSISGKVFPKISDYPSNDLLTLKDIASNNICVGFQTLPSIYFKDTVVDIDMDDLSSIEGNNKYVTVCEFDCSFLDDVSLLTAKPDFNDALTKIRQKNSRCNIKLKDNFTSLFPPFLKIKERLNSLGITNFYYSDKIFQSLWELLKNNPTDFSNEPSDLIFSTCTGYIEYLHRCNRDKYCELISIFPREGGVKDYLYYQSNCFLFRKRYYYSTKEDENVKRLFIYFYNNFKDRIPIEATEFYFGSDNVVLENKDKTILRTLNINPEGKKCISIDINPLYNFFKCGLELGIEPGRLVSAVIGRDDSNVTKYPEGGKYEKEYTAETMINSYVNCLMRTLPRSIEIEID